MTTDHSPVTASSSARDGSRSREVSMSMVTWLFCHCVAAMEEKTTITMSSSVSSTVPGMDLPSM